MRHAPAFSRCLPVCLLLLSACEPLSDVGDDAGAFPPLASRDAAAGDASMAVMPVTIPDATLGIDVTWPRDASQSADAAPAAADAASTIVDAASAGDAAGGSPDAAAPAPATCSGKPGAKRGKSNQTLMAGGARRSFIYYAPRGLDPNTPVPLLIVPHGTNMSGQGMFDITQYAAIADREKFVAIFPDGIDGPGSFAPWNVGSGVCGLGAFVVGAGNDQAFVDAMIAFAEQDQCIDSRHIFMTGFSMGGYFSHETACVSSKIAAIAPHSGGTHDLSRCPAKPKPAILFHFTSDSLIGYECGSAARDQLVKRNGCSASGPELVPVKGGKCEYYKGCSAGQVALCSFDPPASADDGLPSGHGWSGGSKAGAESFGAISTTESASELGWAFFKKHAW
jgi:polyhydroxybutyrate depolymerase